MSPPMIKSHPMEGRRQLVALAALIVVLAQQVHTQQAQQYAGAAAAADGGGAQKSNGPRAYAARHGRAPHERISCRALTSQRRRLAPSADSPTPLALISSESAHANQGLNLSDATEQHQQQQQQQQQQEAQNTARSKTTRVNTSERLFQLRQLLKSNNYDAYLMAPNDEHGSEYVADYDRRLRFMSGFTGSNGYALVMLDRAVLFTDGRYALQAEAELDCNWALVVSNEPLDDIHNWLAMHVREMRGLRVALDARLMPLQEFDYLDGHLKRQDSSFEFALISLDLVDIVWANLRAEAPREPPGGPLEVHPLEFAGQVSWQEKVMRLVERMQALRARHYVISKLDDIAWLLNLRGSDIPMSPLFKAYLLVSRYPASSPSAPQAGQGQAASTRTTTAADQLLAATVPAALYQRDPQQQQQQQQLTLQAPQVLQVPTSQTIKLTLYVDLRKVTQQVRDHLRLESAGSLSGEHHSATIPQVAESAGSGEPDLPGGAAEPGPASGTRIRVELRDYEVFYMDFRGRFSSQTPAPSSAQLLTAASSFAGGQSSAPATLLAPLANAGTLASAPASQTTSTPQSEGRLLLDAAANVAIHVLAKNYEEGRLVLVEPLLQQLKSVKSDLEVEGMRRAHWRDSLAIAMLLGQLEHDVGARKRTEKWTEVSAARELEFFRSLMELNRGQSFDTISAYGANAAVVHYKANSEAPPSEHVLIGNQSTYLLDSGGQYLDGTTDITRTVHFGAPTEFQRETYTRVLMGAIDMMSLIFERLPASEPKGSHKLNDLLARRHLFELGLDYEHGTGHGIGLFSMVHEDPPLIEHYARTSGPSSAGPAGKLTGDQRQLVHNEPAPMRENMFTSVEPGFYQAGEFGVRLENIVVTQRVQQRNWAPQTNETQVAARQWLRFEPISLVPFEPKLMKLELMSNKQKAWLNSYNLMVRLRMTQQINHYLGKLRAGSSSSARQETDRRQVRHQHHDKAAAAAAAAGTSSRLYRFLQTNATVGSAASQGSETLQRPIEPLKFQQLLEQAHRWIMAKTELIALDVPQRLIEQQQQQQQRRAQQVTAEGRRQPAAAAPSATTATQVDESPGDPLAATSQRPQSQQARDDQWWSLGAERDRQRLMLAYMSSLPFNDADAARAAATLASRMAPASASTAAEQASGNSSATTFGPANRTSGSPLPAPRGQQSFGQKCAGLECDLLLLEALNAHQQQQQQASRHLGGGPWTGSSGAQGSFDVGESQPTDADGGAPSGQMLMDLFQISPSSGTDGHARDWWSLASMWPILGLAVILVLQLAVMAYVCGSSSAGRAGNSATSRKEYGAALSRALSAASSLGGAGNTQRAGQFTAGEQQLALAPAQQVRSERPHQLQPIIITESV